MAQKKYQGETIVLIEKRKWNGSLKGSVQATWRLKAFKFGEREKRISRRARKIIYGPRVVIN